MGVTAMAATQAYLHETPVAMSKTGAGTFDGISTGIDGHGNAIIRAWETKGGAARLGARNTAEGRARQGSAAYWNDIAPVEPSLAAYLDSNPAVFDGLRSGTVAFAYSLVRALPDGHVTHSPFLVEAKKFDIERLWTEHRRRAAP